MDVIGLQPLPPGWRPSKEPPIGYVWLLALDAFAVMERSGWWTMVRKIDGHFAEIRPGATDSLDVDAIRYFVEASDEWIEAVRESLEVSDTCRFD